MHKKVAKIHQTVALHIDPVHSSSSYTCPCRNCFSKHHSWRPLKSSTLMVMHSGHMLFSLAYFRGGTTKGNIHGPTYPAPVFPSLNHVSICPPAFTPSQRKNCRLMEKLNCFWVSLWTSTLIRRTIIWGVWVPLNITITPKASPIPLRYAGLLLQGTGGQPKPNFYYSLLLGLAFPNDVEKGEVPKSTFCTATGKCNVQHFLHVLIWGKWHGLTIMSNFFLKSIYRTSLKFVTFFSSPINPKVPDEKTLVLLSPFYNAGINAWVSHGLEARISSAGVEDCIASENWVQPYLTKAKGKSQAVLGL